MSIELTVPSPLAEALHLAIKPKLVEVGWGTGGDDDSALAEYIILMLANGKTQDQIAAELSGDLLNLGSDDPGAKDFAQWLFQQAALLNAQLTGAGAGAETQDAEMDDAEVNIPTGPKSMRNGAGRDKRMFGHLTKQLDRSKDAPLHRVRAPGGERVNAHSRNPPAGPRGRGNRGRMGGMMMPGMSAALTPQQQMEVLSMFEQQAQAMAEQWQQQFMGRPQGRSLFDRVQPKQRRQEKSADVDMDTGDAVCKFNLKCTNKDCTYAHQSPATLPGTPVAIDLADHCSFGAACKNRKCTARHPSPAQKKAHQEVQDCKYWPNCTNANCPFRHMPMCRNGASCETPNCKFTHIRTACKFNPCLNPKCPFKHEEGQQRGTFEDKVWTKEHVSDRKFVAEEGNEELVTAEPDAAQEIVT